MFAEAWEEVPSDVAVLATKLFTFAVGILFGVAAAAALRGALAVWIPQ